MTNVNKGAYNILYKSISVNNVQAAVQILGTILKPICPEYHRLPFVMDVQISFGEIPNTVCDCKSLLPEDIPCFW